MTTVFDPFYDQQLDLDALGVTQRLHIQTSEAIVLVAPGASSTTSGYRVIQVPAAGDLFVCGDVVRVEGLLSLPGRAVQINARLLEVAADESANAPQIDVSGAPPADPAKRKTKLDQAKSGDAGTFTYVAFKNDIMTDPTSGDNGAAGDDGDPGVAGNNAGWVDIRAADITSIHGAALAIRANGGAGGAGQDGQNGQDGGNGGKGRPAFWGGVLQGDVHGASSGADAGAGGAKGRGGQGGVGGSGNTITVLTIDAPGATITTDCQAGGTGANGNDGTAGRDGNPGPGGDEVKNAGVMKLGGKAGGVRAPTAQDPQVIVTATQPNPGKATCAAKTRFADIAVTARADQLAMLTDSVRRDALGLDRDDATAVGDLSDRLSWLLGVTGHYPSNDDAPSAKAAKTLATAMVNSFRIPTLDVFGNVAAWAPIASLSDYDALLGDDTAGAIAMYRDAEQTLEAYTKARDANEETTAQQKSATDAAAARTKDLQTQRDDARAMLQDLSDDISNRVDSVTDARNAVEAAIQSFEANVDKQVTLSFMKYLDVIEQSAFAMSPENPGSGIIVQATEEAKFWNSAFNDVTGDDGQTTSKSYLVGRMDVYGRDVSSLDEAYQVVDGYIQADDPDGYKLLTTQQSLDDLLDNYHAIDGAMDAEKAMAAFVEQVQARNGKIVEYNAAVSTLAQVSADIDQLGIQQGQLQAASAATQAPLLDRFIQGLYDRAKSDSIDLLYRASRAQRFWSLQDFDVFRDLLQRPGPADVNALAVESCKGRLSGKLIEGVDDAAVGDLSPRDQPVVVTFDVADYPDILTSLKKDRGTGRDGAQRAHFWEFTLPLATDASTESDNPFHGMANVRLDEVRCWLIGLPSAADSDGNVKVHLVHQGAEQFSTPGKKGVLSETVYVTHDPVEKVFEYNVNANWPASKAIVTPLTYRDRRVPRTAGALPDWTPLGPFATWRIGLRPEDYGDRVEWHTLTSIRLEFWVQCQGFSIH